MGGQSNFYPFGGLGANRFKLIGNELIREGYSQNVDAFSIIKKIVDCGTSTPYLVEKLRYDGSYKEVKSSILHDLLENPNPIKGYTWKDIEEQIVIYLLAAGNAYILPEVGSGIVSSIDVLPPQNVTIFSSNNFFNPNPQYRFYLGNKQRTLSVDDLTHIKIFNPVSYGVTDSLYGLSLIEVASWPIQSGNDRWQAQASIYQNRGTTGLITDKSQRPMTDEEAKMVNANFKDKTGGPKRFNSIYATNKDLNYIQMGMSPSDMELVKSGIVSTRAVCNVFSLDSSLFNDPENKTYSNRTEAEKALFTNAVIPVFDKVYSHLTRTIVKKLFPAEIIRLRKDYSKVECLQENYKDKVISYCLMKNSGIISANTAAEALKQPKSLDENADKLIISTSLVEQLGQQTNNNGQAANAGGNQGN